MPTESYSAPTAAGPLDALVVLPGSKSLTNRELVLAALQQPGSANILRAPLRARDTELMAEALRALGAGITDLGSDDHDLGPDWLVYSLGSLDIPARGRIDVGLAGTVMRFVPPIAALIAGDTTFDGDEGARRRPMSTMTNALRSLGVEITGDSLPFIVHGTGGVRGGELTIDASASSQFVSGLLLAAPCFDEGLVLRHEGARLPSIPHIEMTIACLAEHGVAVTSPDEGVWVVPPSEIRGTDPLIEPDLSNAAPFLAAALVTGGTVRIERWPVRSTQVGMLVPSLIERFRGPDGGIVGADLDLAAAGELAPTFVGLAALAGSPSRITGIGHLRGHETDRLAALAAEINGLGGDVTELEDGLEVRPRPLHGGRWRTYGDHRMATTGALIGLAVPGIAIEDIGVVSKTMPEFVELWERMLGR